MGVKIRIQKYAKFELGLVNRMEQCQFKTNSSASSIFMMFLYLYWVNQKFNL